MHPEVDLVVINNTRIPTTGGDYVYAVMKSELIRKGYKIFEASMPMIVNSIKTQCLANRLGHIFSWSAEPLAYLACYISSIKKIMRGSRLIITSSCPTFPVFGHLTYHQPKAGMFTPFRRQSNSLKRKIGYKMEENEMLSPGWFFAKKLLKLHLSNSDFTRQTTKKIYGVDSNVLYPPVPVHKYIRTNRRNKRKPSVLIARPEATTGISLLPEIARNSPKSVKFVIIGNIDQVGIRTLRALKDMGTKFDYLGYVKEELKIEIFHKCSMYVNLAINEPFGITVIEALAAGCIPIAHNSGGIPEYLPEELRYSDANEACEKIATYLSSKDRPKGLRNIALRFEEANFRRKFMFFVQRLETLLKQKS